jgi:cytochrome c biogenesis protein CcmG/thiol:disulfide interchange protein DsbE
MSKKIKFIIPLILFLSLVPMFFYALYQDKEEIPSPLIGKKIPDFVLANLEGDQVLNQTLFKGQPMLLNIWASWCPSCIVEHPFLSTLSQSGVKIVGLNYKDKKADAQNFLTELGNPFAFVIFDPKGDLGLELGVYGAPETYLIDADGRIVHKRVGVLNEVIWNSQFEAKWKALTNVSKPTLIKENAL